ncbi:hypothetical protein MAR_020266 [Mya arenaria]|uniref:Uncharacterized protein n=1 Tax=Mya arenaria TaxID=6604 RepID=A0ABY7E4F8_MYAAR|nr:hypothetical protein MAR_020266 [Mya arenaria]
MIWGGITADGRRHLLIDRSTVIDRYRDEILWPLVLPYLRQMNVRQPIYQYDNARPLRAGIVNQFVQENGIQRMNSPAMSPDLSYIENVWDVLGRRVSLRITPHSTLVYLRRFLEEE